LYINREVTLLQRGAGKEKDEETRRGRRDLWRGEPFWLGKIPLCKKCGNFS